jgi:hypothetical protein
MGESASFDNAIFDGRCFREWKGLMQWKLHLIGVEFCVVDKENRDIFKTLDETEREKKEWVDYNTINTKAACAILNHVTPNVCLNLLNYDLAYDMWNDLSEIYAPKLPSLKNQAQKVLHALKFNMKGKMQGFIKVFDRCVADYREQEGDVSEDEEIEWFQAALPPYFHTVMDWFDTLPDSSKTIFALKTKCLDRHKAYLDYYATQNLNQTHFRSNYGGVGFCRRDFGNGEFRNMGQQGQFKVDPRNYSSANRDLYRGSNNNNRTSSRFSTKKNKEVKCYGCGGTGHYANECPSNSRKGTGKKSSERVYANSARRNRETFSGRNGNGSRASAGGVFLGNENRNCGFN